MKQFISIFVLISLVLGGMNVFGGYTVRAQGGDATNEDVLSSFDSQDESTLNFDGQAEADRRRSGADVGADAAEQALADESYYGRRNASLVRTEEAAKNAKAASQEVGDASQKLIDAQRSGDPDAIKEATEQLNQANQAASEAATEAEAASQELIDTTGEDFANDIQAVRAAEAAQLAGQDATQMSQAAQELSEKAAEASISRGILPAPLPDMDCDEYVKNDEEVFTSVDAFKAKAGFSNAFRNQILGCAVKTGRIRFFMIPFFITYLIQFLLGLAGAISMLFILLGGYKYVIGGLTDDKESGKKTLTYAIIGLIVSLSAWVVINVIQYQVTR